MKVRNEATVIAVTRMPNRLWHSPKLLPAKISARSSTHRYTIWKAVQLIWRGRVIIVPQMARTAGRSRLGGNMLHVPSCRRKK